MTTQSDVKIDSDIEEMLQDISKTEEPWKLIMFNDDHHDMIEVMAQVIKAVKCTAAQAQQLMLEAHKTGQAIVMVGPHAACKKARNILEEIDLATDLYKA